MGKALRFAKTHKIEYAEFAMCGYEEITFFIDRLSSYLKEVDDHLYEIYDNGECAEYEVTRVALQDVLDRLDWNSDDCVTSDRETIKKLIEESDQSDDYVHIYTF